MSSSPHLLSAATALVVALWANCAVAQTPPRPNPVDSDRTTVLGVHDDPPIVDHFDLPPTSGPLYVWSKRGAYGLENSSSNTYFVPNATTAEFDAFLGNLPPGASAFGACWSATLTGECAGGTLPAGVDQQASCGAFACDNHQWVREVACVGYSGIVQFTSPGAGVWVVPAGEDRIRETVIGGGAGGQDAVSTFSDGGGGGGGAQRTRGVVPGQQISFVVGAGGGNSQPGGTSSIDGEMWATGGLNQTAGGAGGQGFGGDINGTGGHGPSGTATLIGGGGGARADSNDQYAAGGLGAGGGGKGGDYYPTGANQTGTAPGGGGSGRRVYYNVGRPGAAGMVQFEWGCLLPVYAEEFTTPGPGVWTVPAGTYTVRETVIGGGAGGQDAVSTFSDGGGGGGGAQRVRSVVPGQQISFVVGAGGGNSQPGGTSSIDGEMWATGGLNQTAGGAGGQGFGGDINGAGGHGPSGNATLIGGGGGARADSNDQYAAGGQGAGGGGKGGDYYPTGANQAGTAPGGGGAGRRTSYNVGRPGGAGMVKFEWGPGL